MNLLPYLSSLFFLSPSLHHFSFWPVFLLLLIPFSLRPPSLSSLLVSRPPHSALCLPTAVAQAVTSAPTTIRTSGSGPTSGSSRASTSGRTASGPALTGPLSRPPAPAPACTGKKTDEID